MLLILGFSYHPFIAFHYLGEQNLMLNHIYLICPASYLNWILSDTNDKFVVKSLSHIWVFVTLWTAACQPSLFFTISLIFPKLMSIELVMPSNYLFLCHPILLLSILPSIRIFSNKMVFPSGGQSISPLISSSILGAQYWPGESLFQYPIILHSHAVHGVLKARILKWFAIPFSSGPHSVSPPHHDPSFLGGPTQHGLVSLS